MPSSSNIQALMQLFTARHNTIGKTRIAQQRDDGQKAKSQSITEKRVVTSDDWALHLNGDVCLGLSPLLKNNVRWAVIDVDDYTVDVVMLSKVCKDNGFPFIPVFSKSRGLHLYIFFSKAIKAMLVRQQLTELATMLGFDGAEVFPKQDRLGDDQQASWLNMPYYNGGNVQHAVWGGLPLSLGDFLSLASSVKLDSLEPILEKFLLYGAPYCLQKLASVGVQQGQRDLFLFNFAVYAKRRWPEAWQDKVEEANQTLLDVPLNNVQQTIISQHENKKIWYQCKTDLAPFCNRDICKHRLYGCGRQHDPRDIMGQLYKIMTVPPTWKLEVEDKTIMYENTKDLMNQELFTHKCVEILHAVPPPVKKLEWHQVINEALSNVVCIDAPEDASDDAELLDALKRFILERSNTRGMPDVLRDRVFYKRDVDKNYFKAQAFSDYVKKKRITGYTRTSIYNKLTEKGAGTEAVVINNKKVRVWTLPGYVEQQQDQLSFTIPNFADHDQEEM